MAIDIRPIVASEVDTAHEAVLAAGMNISNDLFHFYVGLEPQRYLAAWEDGRAVGTVGAIYYEGFAFVGSMAVRPECRGRGIAKALLQHLLQLLEKDGVSLAVLEATEAGFPLYRSLGFTETSRTVMYQRAEGSGSDLNCQLARDLVEPFGSEHLPTLLELDRRATGAGRQKMLVPFIEQHKERTFVARGQDGKLAGYLVATPTRIGPWVAATPAAAEGLLDAALTLSYQQEPLVVVPGPNSAGAALVLRAGFDPQRSTRRMWRGPQPPNDAPELLYGLATMGLG